MYGRTLIVALKLTSMIQTIKVRSTLI